MTRTTQPSLGSPAVSAFSEVKSPSVESAHQHMAARRRVMLGVGVSVVFEDRQTVWFRVQELNRFGRGADVRRQLDWYNQLMPGEGRVRAAVWLTARGPRADDAEDVAGGVLGVREVRAVRRPETRDRPDRGDDDRDDGKDGAGG